jgi:hypothetical protein
MEDADNEDDDDDIDLVSKTDTGDSFVSLR